MATVQTSRGFTSQWPFNVYEVDLTTIDPGVDVTVNCGSTTGARIFHMLYEIIERPTSLDPVNVEHDVENDTLGSAPSTIGTARVNVWTSPGGDLTGCVIRLRFLYIESGSGGITAP